MKLRKLMPFLCLLSLVTANTAFAAEYDSNSDWVVPNQYVVDFKDDLDRDDIEEILSVRSLPGTEAPLWEDTKIEIVTVDEAEDVQYLRGLDDIEGVEPVTIYRALGYVGNLQPNDEMYDRQWHMKKVDAEGAWGFSVGRGVTVAVIDTGVACSDDGKFHKVSDLKQTECVEGYNVFTKGPDAWDDHGHGTHVAGTIAQSTNNKIGGVGLAFGAKIMPVKVLGAAGGGSNVGVAAGIRWAADNGAQVINMSLGSPHASGIIQRAVNHAYEKGVVIVAAAGNSGRTHNPGVGYPGACDHVIAVSASNENDGLADFSSRGPQVDIAAPGTNVLQNTICDGGMNNCEIFEAFNGTSMASPHVAGVATMLVGMGLTDPDLVEERLQSGAINVGSNKEHFGAGRLAAADTLSSFHRSQTGWRALFAILLTLITAKFARMRRQDAELYSARSFGFAVTTAATSVGLFCLAPLFLSRHHFVVDLLSRPFGDWTLLLDAGWHSWLPLANVFVPLGVTALLLKVHKDSGPWLAGLFVGTGAYLTTNVMMGYVAMGAIGTFWSVLNIVGCVFLASLLLTKNREGLFAQPATPNWDEVVVPGVKPTTSEDIQS